MKVQTEQGTFALGFRYDGDETVASIKTPAGAFIEGTSRRYHKDVYNKEKARTSSLGKAIQNLCGDDKSSRRVFWQAYLNRKTV